MSGRLEIESKPRNSLIVTGLSVTVNFVVLLVLGHQGE